MVPAQGEEAGGDVADEWLAAIMGSPSRSRRASRRLAKCCRAELPMAVGPPAGDVLVVEDGAGMPLAGVDVKYRPACR